MKHPLRLCAAGWERFTRCGGLSTLRRLDTLLAWVLLGWLGQRLGWSVASGLLPVVLWWGVRCSGGAFFAPRPAPNLWWLAGAAGLLVGLVALPPGQAALLVLLAAAALWGGWSTSLAAATGDTAPTLPGQAMGLMMGSLWLSSQWCLGPGWTDAQAVALHLGLMVGVPGLVAALRRMGGTCVPVTAWSSPALLAAGSLLMAWPDASAWRLAGMGLLVLAWSLPAVALNPPRRRFTPSAALGPLLLLAVGWLAPTLGPAALQSAWALIAALAVLALLPWRPRLPSVPLKIQRWRDAS